ncbi:MULTISPECIES: class E sortase [Streptomyces]|uniref:class E sortase n=1 Tax=Streptomyces TaxID=1883 RepID=UPI001E6552D8|nr:MULTISPECIES: class E sortase [Streptomyces]UFQ16922.1 class E sortase [Streptomyces huasconensis]WCL86525.1 class E sortase [Streptomyces sp. JCM 35825]
MAATTEDDEKQARAETPAPEAPAPRRRARGPLATAVSVFGELLITAGIVLGLFVVYSLWWTNVVADREAHKQSEKVRDRWAGGPGSVDTRGGIGFLHVPAMGNGEILVKPGTDSKLLNDGVAGYYKKPVKSALPQDKKGNFALAAHRDGHGAKFHKIDKIKKGDAIVYESRDKWYVYKVYATLPSTSKYNVKVLDPIPKESGARKPGRYITLTTCTPVFTSTYRYVVWGKLDRIEKVDHDRTPPAELK